MTSDMTGKTCIITGANSGIGKETAVALARMGGHVVMVCRSEQRGEAARADIAGETGSTALDLLLADLSSMVEVRRIASEILDRYPRIDVLLNNAGALNVARTVTVDGFETTFATNHLAYFLLTHLLLDRIKASAPARIINVSSRAHARARIDFEDLQAERRYSPMAVYGQSKLANVLFTYELARRLEGTGVTANCLHPGVVRTGFGKSDRSMFGTAVAGMMRAAGMFLISAKKGAETSIYLASSVEVKGVTGKYFARSREEPSSARSHDEEAARRLWEISERLAGVVTASAL